MNGLQGARKEPKNLPAARQPLSDVTRGGEVRLTRPRIIPDTATNNFSDVICLWALCRGHKSDCCWGNH